MRARRSLRLLVRRWPGTTVDREYCLEGRPRGPSRTSSAARTDVRLRTSGSHRSGPAPRRPSSPSSDDVERRWIDENPLPGSVFETRGLQPRNPLSRNAANGAVRTELRAHGRYYLSVLSDDLSAYRCRGGRSCGIAFRPWTFSSSRPHVGFGRVSGEVVEGTPDGRNRWTRTGATRRHVRHYGISKGANHDTPVRVRRLVSRRREAVGGPAQSIRSALVTLSWLSGRLSASSGRSATIRNGTYSEK